MTVTDVCILDVRTWVESMDMKDAGKAVSRLKGGAGSEADHSVRYRQVLKQDLVNYGSEK